MMIKKYFFTKRNVSITIAILSLVGFIFVNHNVNSISSEKILSEYVFDSLPNILTKNNADLIYSKLRFDAELDFSKHALPNNLKDWESYSVQLRKEIIKKTKTVINHNLPLNTKETGTIYMNGYSIKKISFQTRPGIFATANQTNISKFV